MSFFIRQIKTEAENTAYDHFVERSPYSSFFQTRAWGAFQNQIAGRKFLGCFGVFEDEKIVGAMLMVRHALPCGFSWLYTPRGPTIVWDEPDAEEIFALCAGEIKKCARAQKGIFWRTDPLVENGNQSASVTTQILKHAGAQKAHAFFQPEWTRMVDLTPSEEEILQQMKQKGRYNIRLAAKKGVIIKESGDVALFTKIMQETSVRDGFSVHTEKTYAALLKTVKNNPAARLFIAYSSAQTPLTAAMVIFYGKRATYLYGASVSQNRELMAPYLLHWEIMRVAKADGYTHYDFFGIAPENMPKHPWRGVSEFKEKFGGTVETSMPSHEIIYKKFMYLILITLKTLRSAVRH